MDIVGKSKGVYKMVIWWCKLVVHILVIFASSNGLQPKGGRLLFKQAITRLPSKKLSGQQSIGFSMGERNHVPSNAAENWADEEPARYYQHQTGFCQLPVHCSAYYVVLRPIPLYSSSYKWMHACMYMFLCIRIYMYVCVSACMCIFYHILLSIKRYIPQQ